MQWILEVNALSYMYSVQCTVLFIRKVVFFFFFEWAEHIRFITTPAVLNACDLPIHEDHMPSIPSAGQARAGISDLAYLGGIAFL